MVKTKAAQAQDVIPGEAVEGGVLIAVPSFPGMELLGDSILIRRVVEPKLAQTKIVMPDGVVEDKSPWAIVIATGPAARVVSEAKDGDGNEVAFDVQRIKPGYLVLVKSFGGTEFKMGQHHLIIVKPEHVLAMFPGAGATGAGA